MFQAASYAGHKLCWPGDLVINSLWAWANGLGFSRYHGIVSTAYGVYRLRPECNASYEYFNLALRSGAYDWEFQTRSKGIWKSRLQLTDWAFLDMPLIIPPISEQIAIARYLDYVDSRVRRLTEAKRKLIGLLTEQKQAIIHRAVTRGLDPNVPLKDSGIEWLGMIPQHWEVQRLKHWLKVNEEVLPETTDPNYEFDYIDIGLVEIGKLTTEPKRMKFANAPSRARRVVRKGDTIVSTVRTYLKAVWYAEEPTNNLIASTGFAVLRPSSGTFPKFVSYMVQSDAFTNQVTADSVGIAYPAITETKFGTFPICVPPISEQVAIVEYLDRATAEIDIAVARAERQIELLNEYRTRLIADVVTGKLDVRDATLALAL